MDFMKWFGDTAWLQEYLVLWGGKLVTAAIIMAIGFWVASRVSSIIHSLLGRTGLDPILIKFFRELSYWLLLVVVLLAAVDKLGISVTSFLAVFGALGLAVGLAMKDSLSNFASGIMLIIFRPFRIGDVIETDSLIGTVSEIGFFCTIMMTLDNRKIIMPNTAIFGNTIINFTANPVRRIDLVVGISYGDDIKKAKRIVEELFAVDNRILKDPAPTIGVFELGESSVDLYIRPWTSTENFWAVRCDFLEAVKIAFDTNGITIPFPQRDVYMHQTGS